MIRKRIYLAGPMSGIKDSNYPAFNAEAARLRALGWEVENPAENPKPDPETWENWMRLGIRQLLTCDTLALLPGWSTSKGAAMELELAHKLGITVVAPSRIIVSGPRP